MGLKIPSNHPDWLEPHSIQWYKQVGELYKKYEYPWKSKITEPNGETIFDNEVFHMVNNKKVLDVGCGHGEFVIRCSSVAKEVIGFDVTDSFIVSGNGEKKSNVSFVVGNTKDGLPFEQDEFASAYIRKGPTSAYPLLHRVVRQGGKIIGLHPGDDSGKELPSLFPNLFKPNEKNALEKIKHRLNNSNLTYIDVEVVNSIEYLESADDVLKLCCFGQKNTVVNDVRNNHFQQISNIFKQNATKEGLPITFQRYIVRAES